jgi:hypothetical protein
MYPQSVVIVPFLGIVSPRGCLMFRCTRGSNGPVERTGGEARCQVYQSLDSETPLRSIGASAALAYWSAWSNLEIQCARIDVSPITGKPLVRAFHL